MSASVEERLRRALVQQAETTTTSADAWRRIEGRAQGRRRRPFLRWTLLVPAAAMVTVVLVLVAVRAGDGERTLRVAGDIRPPHLVPDQVGTRFHLIEGNVAPPGDPPASFTYRAFGRRTADGVALAASAVITMPGDRARSGATPEPAPLAVLGQDLIVVTDPFGQRNVRWTQADGQDVGLLTYGLTQDELVVAVESLLRGDAATAAPSLPKGFTPVNRGSVPGTPSVTSDIWHVNDGASLMVTVTEDPGASVEDLAVWLPGAHATKVRGTTAVLLGARETYLAWVERPGMTVTLQARNIAEPDLLAIANGLRPMTDAEWRDLIGGQGGPPMVPLLLPNIGPPPGVALPPPGFVVVPVWRRLAPPCGPLGGGTILSERREGRELACYDVGDPSVDAGDMAMASLHRDPVTATWTLEVTLTADGADRFERLFRDVGPNGQVAFVLDGQLVATSRFGEAPPRGNVVVTGLDEETARVLPDRLKGPRPVG